MKSRTAFSVVALFVAAAAGVALAQETGGGGQGRGGAPPECHAAKHVTRTAPPAPSALRGCHVDADCVIAAVGCCEGCGVNPVTAYRGVARTREAAWRQRTCPPRVVACPACVSVHDPDITAACVRGLCELTVTDAVCAPPPGSGAGHS